MDHLYNRLDGAYPHKWRSNFPSQQAIDNWCVSWAEAFEEEGVTPNHIKDGLKACRSLYDWPPSCSEFIKACKPRLDPTVAYYEAVAGVQARSKGESGEWSSPAVYWAAMPLSFDLQNQTYSQIKVRWEKAFADQIAKGSWEQIPEARVLLAAPPEKMTKEAAAKALDNLGASEVLKNKTDHKLWAKRIINRSKEKNNGLSALQIAFAKEALNVSN